MVNSLVDGLEEENCSIVSHCVFVIGKWRGRNYVVVDEGE